MFFAAIDWGEEWHFVVVLDAEAQVLERKRLRHDTEGLTDLDRLLTHGRPVDQVHVAIELHDSVLLDRLLRLGVKVYGFNPRSAQRARERFTPTGVKDDERDAWSLAEFLRTGYSHLRPLQPDSERTLALREWVRLREQLIRERTEHLQRLRSHLVAWHPQVLRAAKGLNRAWVLDLLTDFPTADALAGLKYSQVTQWARGRRLHGVTLDRLAVVAREASPTRTAARNAAHAAEVRYRVDQLRMLNERLDEIDKELKERVEEHPDAFIFRSFPRAGTSTVASMLAGFGEDRQRWNGHEEPAARWGVVPVTIQSGKRRTIYHRRACDHHQRQMWTWYAFNTVRQEGCWARAQYQRKRKCGTDHYSTLRSLSDTWIKIAHRCWSDRVTYDETLHQQRRNERMQPRTNK